MNFSAGLTFHELFGFPCSDRQENLFAAIFNCPVDALSGIRSLFWNPGHIFYCRPGLDVIGIYALMPNSIIAAKGLAESPGISCYGFILVDYLFLRSGIRHIRNKTRQAIPKIAHVQNMCFRIYFLNLYD